MGATDPSGFVAYNGYSYYADSGSAIVSGSPTKNNAKGKNDNNSKKPDENLREQYYLYGEAQKQMNGFMEAYADPYGRAQLLVNMGRPRAAAAQYGKNFLWEALTGALEYLGLRGSSMARAAVPGSQRAIPVQTLNSSLFGDLPLVNPRSLNRIEPALGQFEISPDTLSDIVKGEPLIFVVDSANNLVAVIRGSTGKGGLKHTQLTGGEAAKAAGELLFKENGNVLINNLSGRYRAQSADAVNRVQSYIESLGFNVTRVESEL